ncbi:MAG: PKD domain-containing protein [Hydrococcus sp. SU_1_0]|nr:PKD domain-containing protein [Hydrococcus sp. SU_1_0]
MVVNNAAPVADAGADQTANEGSEVDFIGSFSDAGTEDTHTVTWDFADGRGLGGFPHERPVQEGDESTATTQSATHTYNDDGEYTATFTVTDNDGAVSSDELTVKVNNVAPTITNLTGEDEIKEGDAVNFSATATDPGDDTLTYTWNFGDDSEPVTGTDAIHIYKDNGNYTVTLTVTDEDGGTASQTLDVTIANVAPSFREINGKTTVNEGEGVNYPSSVTLRVLK